MRFIASFSWIAWLLPPGSGLISRIQMAPENPPWQLLMYDIGLAPNATVEIDLVNHSPALNTYVMILTQAQWVEWSRIELFSLPGRKLNSYLMSYWRQAFYDRINVSFKIRSHFPDRYHLGILNVQTRIMKLSGRVSMENPDGQHLPLQEEHVPEVLLSMAWLFLVSLAVLVLLLNSIWRRSRTNMHWVMCSVLMTKSIVLLLEWQDKVVLSHTGETSTVSDIVWQLLEKIQTILELMMFLLISLGWKIERDWINTTERRFAFGISVISFYLGVFEVACTTTSTCSGYKLSRYILHSLCYLVVIVYMNFNLQVIYAHIADSPATLDIGKKYEHHRAYRIFRWIFLSFIIAPTVLLGLKISVLDWDAVWAYKLLKELVCWTIYASVMWAFRPNLGSLRVFDLTVRETTEEDDDDEDEDEPHVYDAE